MIKIRYADLPQGLHAQVRSCGRRPVIYLLPGLSPAQRREALGRLIRTSRQGYGPRLRVTGVAFALARDVARSTAQNGLAAVRCHPAGSAVLAILLTAAVVCYSLFVTVRLGPRPAGPPAAAGAAPFLLPRAGDAAPSPGTPGRAPAGTGPAVTGPHGAPSPGAAPGGGSGRSRSGSSGTGSSGTGASPGPAPTGTWPAPGGGSPSGPAGASPGPPSSSWPSPGPPAAPAPASPAPSGRPGGLCVQLGLLGVCISG